jgi:hypothetical protein
MGPVTYAQLKAMTLLFLTHDVFCRLRINDARAPPQRSHGYSNPLDQWAACRLLGGESISDHC